MSAHARLRQLGLVACSLALAVSLAGCDIFARPAAPGGGALPAAETVTIHFVNVGQGDAILVRCTPGGTALIDGGPGTASASLVDYLDDQGVTVIDLLVATHPHEDHIGGLPAVFEEFDVLSVVDSGWVYTTAAYRNYQGRLRAEQSAVGCEYSLPENQAIALASNVTMTILGPAAEADSLNNASVVARLDFGTTSALFTGDALYEAEDQLLARRVNLDADILKVSRHGSYSSTSRKFLAAVDADYAVITVGAGNDYGHPHDQTLDRLSDAGIRVYRTDTQGNIVLELDGRAIEVLKPKPAR